MGTIAEVAEELVNLSVKEVNELAFVLNHGLIDNPVCVKVDYYSHITTSKQYGMNLKRKHARQKNGRRYIEEG